jgi:rsbT co-antagonist protein RsbR
MNHADFPLLFDVQEADLERIAQFGRAMAPHIDEVIDPLYDFLKSALGHEFPLHFPDDKALTRAKSLSRHAWLEFLNGRWDEPYVNSRIRIGEVHAQLQIEPRHYMAAVDKAIDLMAAFVERLIEPHLVSATQGSLRRMSRMESAFVVDVYAKRTSDIISKQSRALTDMSTPITALWDGILMLPVVGIVDSRRAQDIMQRMLEQISAKRATVFILDISGVAVVDTAVANHLIRMTKAARLMGSYTIVSGLSPSVAQTIVELGIEVGEMRTTGNLQDALRIAFDRIGKEHPVVQP